MNNRYTYGNEYIVATTGQDYIGLYHITNQGNVYTGKSPNSFDKQLLLTKNQAVVLNETSQQVVATVATAAVDKARAGEGR